jgi:hypothetical protein
MKKMIFISLILLSAVVLVGCNVQKINTPSPLPLTQNNVDLPVVCQAPSCLKQYFMQCKAMTFNMDLNSTAIYTVNVIGSVGDKCHWQTIIRPASSDATTQTNDCLYPMSAMSEDAIIHIFGADKMPGKEAALKTQNDLFQANCTSK